MQQQLNLFEVTGDSPLGTPGLVHQDASSRRYMPVLAEAAQRALTPWSPPARGMTSAAPFQVLDFFCGCGGMSLGFAAVAKVLPSFRMLAGCDIDADALRTYESNLNVPGIRCDVRDLADNEQALSAFLEQTDGYDPNQPLIAIGCAPCQGFTAHRKKHWSREDLRNNLVTTFATLAVKLNPVCIVMENVPELLGKKYWPYFQAARTILEDAGYVVQQAIYNAAAFGVPQERFRAIVIAMRRQFLLPEPLFLDPAAYLTVRQAIGHLPPVPPGMAHPTDNFHQSASHRTTTLDTIRAVPKDGGSRPRGVGPKCLDRIKGFSDVYGRLYWDRPAITITHYARNPASGRYTHPEQDRGLTMREAALLQSFPVGFEFTGSFDSIFKQIGEAVPPKLGCALAAHVLTELSAPPPDVLERSMSIATVMEPVSSSYASVIAGLKSTRLRK